MNLIKASILALVVALSATVSKEVAPHDVASRDVRGEVLYLADTRGEVLYLNTVV